jgi:hypothetical protein
MTRDLPNLLGLLKEHVGAAGDRLDGFQARVAELVGRAGAEAEPDVIREMQAIDALVQTLARLAGVVEALRRAVPEVEIDLPLDSLRILNQTTYVAEANAEFF